MPLEDPPCNLSAHPTMPHPQDEEELDELPPLDGDVGDTPAQEPGLDDVGQDHEENATLDDATGENETPDPNELELDEEDDGWLDEAADNPDLNLGNLALLELA